MMYKEPTNAEEILKILNHPSIARTEEWQKVINLVSAPGFSVAQMKEYKTDMWNYVIACAHIRAFHR